ncbi:MAG: cell division protein FtsQ/DivIB [Kordiimonadaceae bacterium]|nr:cell division protein FtsQ/DivIB [Kordiimonadaceae bacterium]MBO6569141.1 cell division protein FtsQ/DivIB [Kordiimonadaceae bacterium]MBO6964617.1 cell division protein FtsQ/DivIB [Kordiimonadaceae bacterium]
MSYIRTRMAMISASFGFLALATVAVLLKIDTNILWMETTSDAGLVLSNVEISGLQRTNIRDVEAVLDVDTGMPLLAIDLVALQARVEALPWVKEATINRQMSGDMIIEIEERVPFALSQLNGQVNLIDADGVAITNRGLGAFEGLVLLVGKVSRQHLMEFQTLMQANPEIGSQIRSAIWVNDRRWDIVFKNGIRVKLPSALAEAYNMQSAWNRFVDLNREHRLLDREVSVIDMRMNDRLVVRVTPAGRVKMSGEELAL